MLSSRTFWIGAAAGVGILYAYMILLPRLRAKSSS